jgi:hypothetical protein
VFNNSVTQPVISSLRLTEQEAFPSYSWVLQVSLIQIIKLLPISILQRNNGQLQYVGILGSMLGHSNLKRFRYDDYDDDDNNNNNNNNIKTLQ